MKKNFQIEKILDRLKIFYNVKSNKELADKLKVKYNTLTTWIQRNKIPFELLTQLTQNENLSFDWLLTGKGEMFLNQSPGPNNIIIGEANKVVQGKDFTFSDTIISDNITINKDTSAIKPPSGSENIPHFQEEFSTVPLVKAQLSGGGGSFETDKEIITYFAFRKEWLKEKRINPKKAVLMKVIGESMSPVIDDGDIVLIDLNDTELYDSKIYAFAMRETILIKQLRIHPNKYILHSLNKDIGDIEITPDDIQYVKILGRCKWVGKNL